MLPKPGKNLKLPFNYRLIALINTMAKTLESLILDRLKIIILPKIRPEQFGFRSQHSTTAQLTNFIKNITNNLNSRHKTATAFLDIEKAFDRVWHNGLIYKLIKMEVPHQLLNTIKSFLTNRTFKVEIGDKSSTSRQIQAGVPQGSCLSPHLFSVYINDMPQHPNSKTALFADDTIFYASSTTNNAAAAKLQDQIQTVTPWFKEWKININPSKTTTILFSNKSTKFTNKIQIQNKHINWAYSTKYLGIHIDKNLKFSKQTSHAINKAKGVKNLLFPLINSKSPLPFKMKLYLYTAYIKPTLLYAAPCWTKNLTKSNWTKIEAIQSTSFRTITDSPWFVNNRTIRKTLGFDTLKVNIEQDRTKLRINLKNSHYTHLANIVNNNNQTKERFLKKPI